MGESKIRCGLSYLFIDKNSSPSHLVLLLFCTSTLLLYTSDSKSSITMGSDIVSITVEFTFV